jgi:hypothetical protein
LLESDKWEEDDWVDEEDIGMLDEENVDSTTPLVLEGDFDESELDRMEVEWDIK